MTRRAQNAQPSKNAMVLTAKQQRAQRARRNYGSNALGKLVRKKAFRDCDYTADGHLQQFADEAGVIAFEEERYTGGHHQAHYTTEAKETVPREQLALEYVAAMDSMHNDTTKEEGHQTRVHQEYVAEGLHDRHDDHDEKLDRLLQFHEAGCELKRGRFIDIESASAKQLQATILELQDAKAKRVKVDRAQRDAAKKRAER